MMKSNEYTWDSIKKAIWRFNEVRIWSIGPYQNGPAPQKAQEVGPQGRPRWEESCGRPGGRVRGHHRGRAVAGVLW